MKTFEQFLNDIEDYGLDLGTIKNLRTAFQYANGCGAKGGVKFPSTIWFVNIETACNIHDIMWELALSYNDLIIANEIFDNNLKLICDYESNNDITRWLRRQRLSKYVNGVEIHGTNAYAVIRGFL